MVVGGVNIVENSRFKIDFNIFSLGKLLVRWVLDVDKFITKLKP